MITDDSEARVTESRVSGPRVPAIQVISTSLIVLQPTCMDGECYGGAAGRGPCDSDSESGLQCLCEAAASEKTM